MSVISSLNNLTYLLRLSGFNHSKETVAESPQHPSTPFEEASTQEEEETNTDDGGEEGSNLKGHTIIPRRSA